MLVRFDKMSSRKAEVLPNTETGGISINYDPHRILDKVNNHVTPSTPNFNLMTSRPTSSPNDPLPFYMKVNAYYYGIFVEYFY